MGVLRFRGIAKSLRVDRGVTLGETGTVSGSSVPTADRRRLWPRGGFLQTFRVASLRGSRAARRHQRHATVRRASVLKRLDDHALDVLITDRPRLVRSRLIKTALRTGRANGPRSAGCSPARGRRAAPSADPPALGSARVASVTKSMTAEQQQRYGLCAQTVRSSDRARLRRTCCPIAATVAAIRAAQGV